MTVPDPITDTFAIFLTFHSSRETMEKSTEVLEDKKTAENQELPELDGPESDEEQDVNAPDAAKKKKKKKKKAKKTGN